MDNHIFRSALRGFNRQDVMEYIERTQRQAGEAAASLEAQVEELRQRGDQTCQELDERTAERDELQKQLEEMTLRCNHAKHNWDAQAQAKESFRREVSDRDASIRELQEENRRLARQVEELMGQMDSLRRQKEQLAQLELDAHQRAGETLADAENQAQSTVAQAQSQADGILAQAQSQAEAMLAQSKTQAESVAAQAEARSKRLLRETAEQVKGAAAQYEELFQAFQSASGGFGKLKEHLTALQKQAEEK